MPRIRSLRYVYVRRRNRRRLRILHLLLRRRFWSNGWGSWWMTVLGMCMWLQLMWLQFENVRGPVGVVTGPKSTPKDPDRNSDNLNLQPHKL
jgi:hypothetical protein